ncbi:MAG TPA: hypothetical protein VIQ29_13205 [Ancylobacter sp.]
MAASRPAGVPPTRSAKQIAAEERTQTYIALIAAAATVALVLVVMLLMAFIEYQSRLIRYQPGIRTAEIMDSVAREVGIQNEFEVQQALSPSLRDALENLRLAQTQAQFRIGRICSLFGSDDGQSVEDPRIRRCRAFLTRVPFDGTLSAEDVPPAAASAQGETGQSASEAQTSLNDAVVASFVREMESDYPDAKSRISGYLPLFKANIIEIARLNQEIHTELTFEFEKQKEAYRASCLRNLQLSSAIKYKDGLIQDCDLGALESNTSDPKKIPAPAATPPIGQGQVGFPGVNNPVSADPNLDKQRRFDLVRHFQIYNKLSFGWAETLLLCPPDYLATWLLFFGGALGSTLKILFWHIMPMRENKWSYLAVEPAQGLVCAVMLFILFRSGVVVVAGNPSQGLDAPPLSPYFVAFLAIGAGLMSDQVLQAFRTAATAVIGKGAMREPSRWAVGLQAALDQQAAGGCPLTLEQFAGRIDAQLAKLNDWLDFKARVEPEYQERIQLVLGIPACILFTDINPNAKPLPPIADDREAVETPPPGTEDDVQAEPPRTNDTAAATPPPVEGSGIEPPGTKSSEGPAG